MCIILSAKTVTQVRKILQVLYSYDTKVYVGLIASRGWVNDKHRVLVRVLGANSRTSR